MTTRRHPRTLCEAFGPYADRGPIVDPSDKDTSAWLWVVVSVASTIAAVVLAALNGGA